MSKSIQDFLSENLVSQITRKRYDLSPKDVRRAHNADIDSLEKLVTETTQQLFGDVNYKELLDKCNISFCVTDEDKQIVAFMCFDGHPNVPSIPPWEWSHWLYNIYHLETITPKNTLWIHLAVWEPKYTYSFMDPILRAAFAENSFLEYIIIVIPPGITTIDWLQDHGTRVVPPGFSEPNKVQTLFLLVRQHFVTKYKIRRAVEEDNDDLVPLIHIDSERLQEIYGEFYIGEILTRHCDSGRQLIVAEYAEHAVAVLCLNAAINDELLNQAFELIPFYGLRKAHPEDDIEHADLSAEISTMGISVGDEEQIEDDLDITVLQSKEQLIGLLTTPEYEEVEIGIHQTASEDSEDDFSIINVSSVHLLMENSTYDASSVMSRDSTDYSAVILSFNDYEMHLFADRSNLKALSFDDLEHHSSKQTKSMQYCPRIPLFHGEINAFTLELAAANPEHEIESLSLLLEAAFECFPDRDYCVLTLPSTCPPFPMLQHFVRVIPRPISTYPHELYVLHRNAILSNISARVAVKSDTKAIEELLSQIAKAGRVFLDFMAAVNENSDISAFVLLSEDRVVGLAIITDEENFEYFKSHYQTAYWIDEDHHKCDAHGFLEHLVLSPIFQRHSRFFLREILRLTDYSVLYYCIRPSDVNSSTRDHPLCCVISELIAVMPRIMPEFTNTNLEGCEPAEAVAKTEQPYALYLATARLCSLRRFNVNTKIVIVGCSDTALAFLDSLICSWSTSYHVTFTNVTLVSPHGLNYEKKDNKIRNMMFVTKSNFNYRYMNLTSMRTYVNVVNAVMTGIDRRNKLLIVNDNSYLAYDLLFLFCGGQYQKPSIASASKDKKQKKSSEFPENVFLINTETDATNALKKIKKLVMEQTTLYTIIVYGYLLDAFCCVAALLEYGVPAKNITFIESFPTLSDNKSLNHVLQFSDPEVDEAITASIKNERITFYSSYYFVDWFHDKEINRITSAKFESKYRRIEINCMALFMYSEKTVSGRTFLAILKAGLVFDGALVINPDCRTNDPYIYAAGTITKYARRYYADHLAHKYYNLEEIGSKLGQRIREKLCFFYDEYKDKGSVVCKSENMLVPTYEKPLMTYCRLPGNLFYLLVTKPGKQVPLEVAMSSDDYGQVLVTGDCKQLEKQGYFRLHLNQFGVVETITCLSKSEIDRKNLTCLWGKHEKLLNNLQTRFEMVLITDLFEYFREPWSCAIYHDRFPLLEAKIREHMMSFTATPGASPLEDLIKAYKENDWTKLSSEQKDELESKFTKSPFFSLLEKQLLDFLKENNSFLPMYAHPMVVRYLLQGIEKSPLFEPQ